MGFIFFRISLFTSRKGVVVREALRAQHGKEALERHTQLIGPFSPRFIFSSQRCCLRGTVRANIRKKYHLGKLSLLDNAPN